MTQFSIHPDRIHRAFIIMVVGWCALLWLPAVLSATGYSSIAEPIYKIFGAICHQRPERSLYFMGSKLGVCARCTAIYLGFAGMTLVFFTGLGGQVRRTILWQIERHARTVLLIAVVPMLVDVLMNDLNIYESSLLSRVITGGVFGVLSAPVLIPQLVASFQEILPALFTRLGYAQKTQ